MAEKKPDKKQQAINAAKAVAHPLRVRILQTLGPKDLWSPNGLAAELGEPLGNVSYHVKTLLDYDAVVLVKTEPRRGAVEHFYRSTGRIKLEAEANSALEKIAKVVSEDELYQEGKSSGLAKIAEILEDAGHTL